MPLPDELRAGARLPRRRHRRTCPATGGPACWSPAGSWPSSCPTGLPWVHLDIAGPAFNTGAARDYTPKGGTGAAVRTIITAVERLAAG